MLKKLIVLQDGNKECGSAALLSIIRYFDGNTSISNLVELTKTTKEGTNFHNIKQAATKIGLDAKGYKIDDFEVLSKLKYPILCQFINHNYTHFIVIYKINNNKITIMDPSKGKVVIDKEKFLQLWTGYIMIFEKNKKLPNYISNKFLHKLVLEQIIKNKKIIINILILSIIFTIMSCSYSFYFKIIIDKVLGTDIHNLLIVTFIFILIILLKNLSNYFRNSLLIYINQKIDYSLILNTYKKILFLPYNYYKNKTTGEVVSRINDLAIIKNTLSKIIITVCLDLLIMIVSGIILLSINKTLFLILIIITLIYLVIFMIFKPLIKKMTNINQENNARINSYLVESISSYETIKNLHSENVIKEEMNDLYTQSLKENVTFEKISNIELLFKDITSSLGNILIIYLGTKYVLDTSLTLGDLIMFTSLMNYFVDPIRNIIDLGKEYYFMINSLKRANNLFEIKEEQIEELASLELNGNIKINNLNFSYNDKDMILNNINLEINNKEKVLILGSSGSGKSTLLKIIYKYYLVPRNTVLINNYDLSDYSLSTIRNKICYISQMENLFTKTIKNNIILNRDVSYQDFLKICKLTCVDDIVKNYFLGYDTLLEENGINISGGQRQRIILARALLKKSKIIMIDEGLNEIDINLERKILKNIFNYYQDKTIIIVSHRKDNMDLYDKVINMDNGLITETCFKNKGIQYEG